MLKKIKEATKAAVQRAEYERKNKELFYETKRGERKIKNIDSEIEEKQQTAKDATILVEKKIAQVKRVSEDLQIKEQLLQNISIEIQDKKTEISNLDSLIAEKKSELAKQTRLISKQKEMMEKHVEKKRKDSPNQITNSTNSITTNSMNPIKMNKIRSFAEEIRQYARKKEKEIEEQELHKAEVKYRQEDVEFKELFQRFVELSDVSVMIEHNADEFLLTKLEERQQIVYSNEELYTSQRVSEFYHETFAPFISLLRSENYQVKGNEGYYILLLKEKALQKHFRLLSDDFIPLFTLSPIEKDVRDVIHAYIRVVGEERTNNMENLSFLSVFLKEQGFMSYRQEVFKLNKIVNNEMKQYKARELKNFLLKNNTNGDTEKPITIEEVDVLSGEEFEVFLCNLLSNLGFRAELTKGSGDQGADIIAYKQGKKYVIQAKRYSGTVGTKAVQEVISGKGFYEADEAWVITNSSYTRGAIELANKTQTKLWDRNRLQNIMEAIGI
ncbi:restriction endonuclease [Bacillus cereus]|uniref:restriction endonuclease n=1 Tax=Bacillus cereus TaxID=1396 RepID=UPI00227BF8D0|nr:restriction endonuclease [Bacillus cereus]WAI12302.1 restriction endonuclease [Bacillus cereus]